MVYPRSDPRRKVKLVVPTNNRARRLIVVGAFAVAAAAAPATVGALSTDTGSSDHVVAKCLAWFGNKDDGYCLSYSNPNSGASGGFPPVSIGSPGSGSPGLSSGPLLPGQTISTPIG
jgi:hypothetical protein